MGKPMSKKVGSILIAIVVLCLSLGCYLIFMTQSGPPNGFAEIVEPNNHIILHVGEELNFRLRYDIMYGGIFPNTDAGVLWLTYDVIQSSVRALYVREGGRFYLGTIQYEVVKVTSMYIDFVEVDT